ncbi:MULTISPECIES: hypothetical protein [unclassified Nocardioides]|uniref:hypothetical protein n=1 Tax=unclassified Nocardioides TaxID=2615069 RepID=UPI000702F388|nr:MULTISPECIES: hypothetical protein [unclassified Nocardioides]KRC54942.1 hypothetical protein ASE19_05685 [Nocardioides sp. Root79]KRC73712.1 hypothetical protein ASE20_03530 [Nocardioides sp. Root240]
MQVRKKVGATLVALLSGIVAVLAASLVVVPAAHAASHSAALVVKGPNGSAYTAGHAVSLAGKEGAVLAYTFQVRNTGTTLAQYRIDIQDWAGAQAQLYDGTLLLKPLASSPDGYYTKALPPGGNQTLTVKIPIPVGTDAYEHYSTVNLYATDGAFIDSVFLVAEEPALLAGATSADLFLKNGSQLAVGGPGRTNQIVTAPTISGTQVATFTVTLQNSTAPSASIGFRLDNSYACGQVVTVKDGALDVTAAALAGTYLSPPLAKLGKRNLTVTVKNVASCAYVQLYARAKMPGGSFLQASVLEVNRAA